MNGQGQIDTGFSERRSMRAIMNKYIMMAENSGYKEFNDWIQGLLEMIDKKDLQYRNLLKEKNDDVNDKPTSN